MDQNEVGIAFEILLEEVESVVGGLRPFGGVITMPHGR